MSEHSAEHGVGYLAVILYNTEHDGAPVPEDVPEGDLPRTLHGPFDTAEAAMEWIYTYPDGDTDVHDMQVICFNRVLGAAL